MKQKYEGKDLQGLVDLGREQGYLTFDQVNDFLPQDVASPTDLRAALDSFEDLDIKVLEEVPTTETETAAEEEAEEAEPEAPAPAAAAESVGESSDPVRLYLKEMGTSSSFRASRKLKSPNASRPARSRSRTKFSAPRSPSIASSRSPKRCCRAKRSYGRFMRKTTSPRPILTRSADPRPKRSSSRS